MSRIERGIGRVDIITLAMIGDVLGVDVVLSVHPGGAPVRDAGHLRVMGRLRALFPPHFVMRTEVPTPIMGDRRAIDAIIASPPLGVGFELETRLIDAQALVRRVLLKQRDTGLACMVLVFPDTAANRLAVAAAAPTLRPAFPLEPRAILATIRAGRTPSANGILFV